MATANANPTLALLGKTVHLSEVVSGFEFERSGVVIGVVVALPGTRCTESILLDQEDGNCEFYDLSDVTLRLVQ
uniref:Uncharacterized protein n=1 Tax=uncultured prokaryote TaxID=198431 RepID=A0A0H5Q0Z7_9ZZZZ|nr:hypothetical protein [uncultured prokaryote]